MSLVTLKDGVLFGTYQVFDRPVLQEPFSLLVADVTAQSSNMAYQTGIIAQLMLYVIIEHYPDAKSALLDLLVKFRLAIPLPGEPLGVIDKITMTLRSN